MQSKKRENSVVTTRLTDDGRIVFNVLGAGEFTFDPDSTHAAIRRHAMLHGFVQRISDKAAKGKDPETGLPVSPQVKFDAMQAMARHYESGTDQWRLVGERAPKRDDLADILLDALELAYPAKTREDLREWLSKRSKAEKVKLVTEPRIAKIVAELREGDDTGDDILAELE